jgi:hypothetical protein
MPTGFIDVTQLVRSDLEQNVTLLVSQSSSTRVHIRRYYRTSIIPKSDMWKLRHGKNRGVYPTHLQGTYIHRITYMCIFLYRTASTQCNYSSPARQQVFLQLTVM